MAADVHRPQPPQAEAGSSRLTGSARVTASRAIRPVEGPPNHSCDSLCSAANTTGRRPRMRDVPYAQGRHLPWTLPSGPTSSTDRHRRPGSPPHPGGATGRRSVRSAQAEFLEGDRIARAARPLCSLLQVAAGARVQPFYVAPIRRSEDVGRSILALDAGLFSASRRSTGT